MFGQALLLTVLSLAAQCAETGFGSFRVPEGDLPSAIVNGYEVAFTRNGSFVVGKDGRWLFDGGLCFADAGWKTWGTQIRRSEADDDWRLAADDLLLFEGTLSDENRRPWFKFEQQVAPIANGLRFRYEVTPNRRRTGVREFGLVFHLPAKKFAGGEVGFWPGFSVVPLAAEMGEPHLIGPVDARGAEWACDGARAFSAVGQGEWQWFLFDDRNWELNLFRLFGRIPSLATPLRRGDTVSLEFDLLLGADKEEFLPQPPGRWILDRYGRTAFLLDGRKMIEGGVYLGEAADRWLFADVVPAGDLVRTEDGIIECSQVVDLGDHSAESQVAVRAKGEEVVISSRIVGEGKPEKGMAAGFSLAVPVAHVRRRPAVREGDGQTKSIDIETPQGTLQLTSPEITVSVGRLNAERVWLLEFPPPSTDDSATIAYTITANLANLPAEAKP